MKLHVDLETLQLIQAPGQRSPVAALRFKRGDSARLQVVFLANGVTPATIGDSGTLEIQIGIKPRNQFDRSYLLHTADWSMPSEGDDTPTYGCELSFNTVELNAALNVGSAAAAELAEITLMGEITWREGAGEPTSTRTFLVTIENDVNRGDEGVPASAEPAYPAAASIELVARKGVASGYAGLDSGGKVLADQLAITADSISDSTTIGRALVRAPSTESALDAIGAMPAPEIFGELLHGVTQHGWATIAYGQRAALTAPQDYQSWPLPAAFKGLALYVLDPQYAIAGYSIKDLLTYMESYHYGVAFWENVNTVGAFEETGAWTMPGFAVLNLDPTYPISLGTPGVGIEITSQLGRQNPSDNIFLEPWGMATLRFIGTNTVAISGDLTTGTVGYY